MPINMRSRNIAIPTIALAAGFMVGFFQNCSTVSVEKSGGIQRAITSYEANEDQDSSQSRPPVGSWYWETSGRRAILVMGQDDVQLFDWPARLKNPMRLARVSVSELNWAAGDAQVLSYKGALFQRSRDRNISDGERFDTWCTASNDDLNVDLRLGRPDKRGLRTARLFIVKNEEGFQQTETVVPGEKKNSFVGRGLKLELGSSPLLKMDRDPAGDALEERVTCVGKL